MTTPGPWVEFADQGDTVAIMPAGRDGDICHFAAPYPSRDDARLMAAAPKMLEALLLLTGNPHIDLGDCIYIVRDRELKGWDGPAVLAWSQAITSAKDAVAAAIGTAP